FAGNIRRHGPVDDITVNGDGRARAPGDVLTKVCPACQEENALAAKTCTCCGPEFVGEQREIRHSVIADDMPVLSQPVWLQVRHSEFRLHRKYGNPNAPPTLRVDHLSGFTAYSEYISFEGINPYARQFARSWWLAMGGGQPVPRTVSQALERRHELSTVA